jgi:hypothetical protein
MANFDEWGADGGDAGGGSAQGSGADGGTPVVNGGLLDPRSFATSWARPGTDAPSLERPDPEITGPLQTDYGSEVLQDILDAQAKLNGQAKPSRLAPHPETWSVNGRTYYAIGARGFDPTRSNGLTAMQTPADDAAAWAGMSTVAVPYGDEEQAGYIARSPSRVVRVQGRAGGGDRFDTYTYDQPVDFPPIHGHIDRRRFTSSVGLSGSGEKPSDGFVDSTEAKKGLGDAWSLDGQHPQPLATISHNQVGWHVLDNGQLKFFYPPGSMTPSQIGEMQANLNQEQQKFLRPK